MSQPVIPSTTIVTFVIRFWPETSAGEVRWRGRIEHVQSGEGVAFLDLEGMLRFMRQFGIATGDEPVADDQEHSSEESLGLSPRRSHNAIR